MGLGAARAVLMACLLIPQIMAETSFVPRFKVCMRLHSSAMAAAPLPALATFMSPSVWSGRLQNVVVTLVSVFVVLGIVMQVMLVVARLGRRL